MFTSKKLIVGAVLLIATAMVLSGMSYAGMMSREKQVISQPLQRLEGQLTNIGPAAVNRKLAAASGYSEVSTPSGATLTVTVGLKPSNVMNAYLSTIENPASPQYRHFLTASQIGNEFGINSATYGMIVSYFKSYGLQVMQSSTRLLITLNGTVSQLESALHTTIGLFSSNTSQVYLNTLPLSLPSQIANQVLGVAGLDGAYAQPSLNHLNLSLTSTLNTTGDTSLNVSQALYYASGNYTWSPFGGIYGNYQFLWPGTLPAVTGAHNLWYGRSTIASEPDLGQGVTIAVTEVGLISPTTISEFSQEVFHNPNQLPDRFTQIGVDIPNLSAGIQDAHEWGWTGETALDIEYIAAMAPEAHIVLVGVPNDLLEGFDVGYQAISQYLTNGTPLPTNSNVKIITGPAQGATDISITSNSHSFEAIDTEFFASPFDVLVQEELVNILAIQGVTQFFATGDSGSNNGGTVLQTSRPVESPGVVGVGGGQLTVNSNGVEFPMTGVSTTISDIPMEVAQATGISSFTYWSFGGGGGGTYAASTTIPQPWWENALDTYSTGTEIIPVISNAAAFNMTLFNAGHWFEFYGGTSFATPISAGEWALIEEQANVAYGNPKFGSINALLFEAHNAFEAGALSTNVFVQMTDIGVGWDWAPFNSFDWNFLNTSQEYPQDLNLPEWYPSIFNPAGPGWNFLQGLGLPLVDEMDAALIGQVPSTQHALTDLAFAVLLNTSSGLESIQSLTGGVTYNFTVVTSQGSVADDVTVTAYSGGPNNGTYGGGAYTTISTTDGSFQYTPSYAAWPTPTNASEYGFFFVRSDGGIGASALWGFQQFAVDQPPLQGALQLSVLTPYGFSNNSTVEVTMFNDFNVQDTYNFGTLGLVTLNGAPLMNAMVMQTAVSINYQSIDPTVSPSQYAPGMTIGQWLSDFRGQVYMWNNPLVAANNGPVPTQIYTVQAFYDNMSSNVVTVYVEPQAGAYIPELSINPLNGNLQGQVVFSGMKYLNFVNVSIVGLQGAYVNETFPVNTTYNGAVPVNMSIPQSLIGMPIEVSMMAEGENTISLPFSFFVYSTPSESFGDPIIWYMTFSIPYLGCDPQSSVNVSAPMINGVTTIHYSGMWNGNGSYGELILSYGDQSSVLVKTDELSGAFVWNTTSLPDGFYVLTYTVITPTGLKASSSAQVYLDNNAVALTSEIEHLQNELTSASLLIANLRSELASDNASLAAMKSQLNSVEGMLNTASQQLKAAELQYNQTAAELSTALVNSGSEQATILALRSQLQTENATIGSDVAQIATLRGQLSQLQSEMNSRRSATEPAWIAMFGGAGPLAVLLAGLAALALSLLITVRSARKKQGSKGTNAPQTSGSTAMGHQRIN
ncbi:MAG: protease pro-enzyme activation domain-containing protein [Methanomassiliicoccales archaeon]